MQNGYSTHRSKTGACLSIALLLVTFSYAITRVDVLMNHKQSNTSIWNYDNYLNETFELSMKDSGFNFAFGLVSNDIYFEFGN